MIGYLLLSFAGYLFISYRFLRSSPDLMLIGLLSYPVKIIYSLLILYAVIEYWDYGDLETYFGLAAEISQGEIEISNFFWGSYLVAIFNSIPIFLFGESLVGLSLLTSLTSYIYFVLIFVSVSRILNTRSWLVLAFLIFIPGIGMQSSYIGKEMYILPLIGFVFYAYSKSKVNFLWIAVIVITISMIRPYQGMILLVSIFSVFFILGRAQSKLILITLSMSFLGLFLMTIGSGLLLAYDEIVLHDFSSYMDKHYGVGNSGLADLPFPFGIFQVFRPFPHEAYNLLPFFKSFENLIFIFLFFYFIFNINSVVRILRSSASLPLKRFFLFLLSYFAINYILFSFSGNIGDLSRRQVYFMPQLFILSYIVYVFKRSRREGSTCI